MLRDLRGELAAPRVERHALRFGAQNSLSVFSRAGAVAALGSAGAVLRSLSSTTFPPLRRKTAPTLAAASDSARAAPNCERRRCLAS